MRLIPVIAMIVFACLLVSCSKDKFQTIPQIEVKDYNSKTIPRNGTLVIRFNYFDKEGDLGNGTMYVFRQRLNKIPPTPADDRGDELTYVIPEFTDKDKGELRLSLKEDNFLSESQTQNDTMLFKVAVTDREGHTSDTLVTDQIIVLLP
jgi:hypothetical protein